MSAHHLTIAKASFAAGLLRPDITKVGRDDLTAFYTLLESAVATCTAHNVQKCKEWIVANIASSAARAASLGKYLCSYSKHTLHEPRHDPHRKDVSASRKRLHILYVLHDVIHHTRSHTSNLSAFSTFTAAIQPFLVELVQSTALEQRRTVQSRLDILLGVWEAERFYSKDYVNKLQQARTGSGTPEHGADEAGASWQKKDNEKGEAAFVMPATHGDPSTPYYDLPAGNLLPFLEPGSSAPIRPEQVRPLHFTAGPADKPLVNAMKDFLTDVESIDHMYRIADQDIAITEIDELGQISLRNEAGDLSGDTYYGWSRAFCEKMKRRRRGPDDDQTRGRRYSDDSSRSSSRSPKRRRYSDSDKSRSPSPSRSPPRFRTTSPPRTNDTESRWQRFQAPEEAGNMPQLPARALAMNQNMQSVLTPFQAPPLGPNGLPMIPPRPLNWNGPWPPPPPIAGAAGQAFPPQPNRGTPFPPPPPPPGYPGMYSYGNNVR